MIDYVGGLTTVKPVRRVYWGCGGCQLSAIGAAQLVAHLHGAPESTPEVRHSPSGNNLTVMASHSDSGLTCHNGHRMFINRCPQRLALRL